MAQITLCDIHGQGHPSDWLVTRQTDGETMAYCNDGFLEFMTGAVEAANQAVVQEADDAALARLEAVADRQPELDAAELEAEGPRGQEPGEPASVDTDPEHVIRRGQSARAIAYRERVEGDEAPAAPRPRVVAGPGDGDEDDEDDVETGATPPA